ncbi:MAG: acetyl-CoA carboxylase carboxyltransferase subunit alpha [bacterium]|nr:acetyl-CoA carboxylase carboxyltransferase subunit alpha [bacterium]
MQRQPMTQKPIPSRLPIPTGNPKGRRNMTSTETNRANAIDTVKLARHTRRPTTLDYIGYMLHDFLEFHGDRRFSDDPAIVGGIGFLDDIPVTVIGHQKGRDVKENVRRNFGMAHPEGYRKALRLMEEAERFGRPVINFIDTPGAYPGIGAEERGQAEAIAFNLYKMSTLKTPIISVVTGEGGSGGALALGIADRVYMLSNTIYSVISPEGCASILWRDASKSDQAAEALKLTAQDHLKSGIIDGIVEEPAGGAHEDHDTAFKRLKKTLTAAIKELLPIDPGTLLEQRYQKYRNIGAFSEPDDSEKPEENGVPPVSG